MDLEDCPIDPLLHAVRRARKSAELSRVDLELAATVLEALLEELPEHFGPDAHAAYVFWLRNRIEALCTNQPFRRWLTTSSYQRHPELLTCEPP
jgi:hypothetical protein